MAHTLTRRIFIGLLSCWLGVGFFSHACASDFDLAETAATLRVWHSPDGLASDSVTAILQTRDGFLWVGTAAGLVRFDGVAFTRVGLPDSATNNPVRITALCEASDGGLWVGTQANGLFELYRGSIRSFTSVNGLLDEGITSLAADKQGMVWVGTESGLDLWTGRVFQSFSRRDGLPEPSLRVAAWLTAKGPPCVKYAGAAPVADRYSAAFGAGLP